MDWKKIKTEAKEKINGKKWDIWKPSILIGLISSLLGVTAISIFGKNTGNIASTVFSLLLIPAEVGYISYILKLTRNQEYNLDELKRFYGKTGILIVLSLLVSLYVIGGTLLFIIPGIIFGIMYTHVYYVFCDNEELSAKECMDKSKELINGNKVNYVLFQLSFLGWVLLSIITCGIALIWTVPYITVAQTLYYEELKNKQIN